MIVYSLTDNALGRRSKFVLVNVNQFFVRVSLKSVIGPRQNVL
jgi:hypothetical protein